MSPANNLGYRRGQDDPLGQVLLHHGCFKIRLDTHGITLSQLFVRLGHGPLLIQLLTHPVTPRFGMGEGEVLDVGCFILGCSVFKIGMSDRDLGNVMLPGVAAIRPRVNI